MTAPIADYDPGFVSELRALRAQEPPPRQAPAGAAADFGPRVAHMAIGGVTQRDIERFLGRNDLLRVNYLERGLMAARAVCRLRVSEPFGGGGAWGTGFLVAPGLLLTNHHVISTQDDALRTQAEFGYDSDAGGRLRAGVRFTLEPQHAFLTDPALDFTLVAVASHSEDGSVALEQYGWLRLNPEPHKVEQFEFVSLVQHPQGDEKFVAVRENKVLKIGDAARAALDNWLWYASDTAPGSSGAPAFNDSWQVVAIHRRGVPEARTRDGVEEYQLVTGKWVAREEAERLPDDLVRWVANEGVRVSKVVARAAELLAAQGEARSALAQAWLDDATGARPFPNTPPRESVIGPPLTFEPGAPTLTETEIAALRPRRTVRPAAYYDGRTGYDPRFLGVKIPLPTLTERALRFGAPAAIAGAGKDHAPGELKYTHFSVVFNATRRLAFYTAVNVDGKQWQSLSRGSDAWYYDPRLPFDLQVGDELYGNEPNIGGRKNWFDRGHLVRRLDPVWGPLDLAAQADEDTFHWTNCSPQYWAFNQGAQLWQGLENFVLYNTDQEDIRACIFSGPLFQEDDELHRGIYIPQYYWKVIAVRDARRKLYSSAYVVSQQQYARNIPFEQLPVGQYNNFQVPLARLEAQTGLSFSRNVRNADVLKGATEDVPLRSLADVVHPRR